MPLTKGDVVITRIEHGIDFNDRGGVIRQTSVEFTVRGQGPFSRKYPTEGFSAENAIADITNYARQLIEVMEFDGGSE